MKEMGTPDVHIDTRLNKAVWAKGIRNVPYRIREWLSRKRNKDSPNKLYIDTTMIKEDPQILRKPKTPTETSGIQNTLSTNGCNSTKQVRSFVQKEGWQSKRKTGVGVEERGEKQVDSGVITQARNQIPLEKTTTSSEDFQTSEVESKGRKRICPSSPGDVSVRGTEAKGPPPRVRRSPPPQPRAGKGRRAHLPRSPRRRRRREPGARGREHQPVTSSPVKCTRGRGPGRICKHSTDTCPSLRAEAPSPAGRATRAAAHARGTGKRRSLTTGSRFTRRIWCALRRAAARLRSPHTSPPTRMVGKVVSVGVAALQISSRVRPPKQGPGAAGLAGRLSPGAGGNGGGGGGFLPRAAGARAPRRLLLAAALKIGLRVGPRAAGGPGRSGTRARQEE
eukprot:bmy_16742T0